MTALAVFTKILTKHGENEIFSGSKNVIFSDIRHSKYFSLKCKLVYLGKWIANGQRQNYAPNNFYGRLE